MYLHQMSQQWRTQFLPKRSAESYLLSLFLTLRQYNFVLCRRKWQPITLTIEQNFFNLFIHSLKTYRRSQYFKFILSIYVSVYFFTYLFVYLLFASFLCYLCGCWFIHIMEFVFHFINIYSSRGYVNSSCYNLVLNLIRLGFLKVTLYDC